MSVENWIKQKKLFCHYRHYTVELNNNFSNVWQLKALWKWRTYAVLLLKSRNTLPLFFLYYGDIVIKSDLLSVISNVKQVKLITTVTLNVITGLLKRALLFLLLTIWLIQSESFSPASSERPAVAVTEVRRLYIPL